MYRTIILAKGPIQAAKYMHGRLYTCHISRRGRMHSKYHKQLTPSSVKRLKRYIEASMIETVRSHDHFIKYESKL